MMLGEMRLERGLYRDNEPVLVPDGRDLGDALASAIARLPQGVYQARDQRIPPPETIRLDADMDGVKPNAFCIRDGGTICIREENGLRELPNLPPEARSRLRGLIEVRDALRICLRTQADGSPEDQVTEARRNLNLAYDRFVGRYGQIGSRTNQRAFDGDPDLPLLLSLEHYDGASGRVTKAAVFRERTIHRRATALSAETPKEALLVSLNEKGRVDLEHMADLLQRPVEEVSADPRLHLCCIRRTHHPRSAAELKGQDGDYSFNLKRRRVNELRGWHHLDTTVRAASRLSRPLFSFMEKVGGTEPLRPATAWGGDAAGLGTGATGGG